MKRRDVALLAGAFLVSVTFLVVVHFVGDPAWIENNLSASPGSDGILWQVQTTFFSVGFAGLAIAAQLFAESPLAIGASRGRVLEYVGASWFVGVGLVANAVIAVETIWMPSALGLLVTTFVWFVPTVVLLVVSAVGLVRLFGHPSRLDEVVRRSLVETLSERLGEVSRKYADATKELDDLVTSGWALGGTRASSVTVRVPVPEVDRVVRSIKPKVVRQAIALLGLRATEMGSPNSVAAEEYAPPQVILDVEPGDRTRLGETAFRLVTSSELDEATTGRVVRLLQSSIEFEPSASVTPYEETDREIASLKDAIGTNLRSGALATAERALELLGHVVRGVWMAGPERLDSPKRAAFTRRDWLFRSIGEVEQDVLLSPRAAGIFVSAAMTRALEAPRTGSTEYVDECLRSFTRLWSDVLQHGGSEFRDLPSRITTCIQNLTAYSYSSGGEQDDLPARGVWAMVELVKLAIDAKKSPEARSAAEELNGLFEFDPETTARSHVRGGQLVLSGWLDYLSDRRDERDPADPALRALVTPHGTWSELLAARGAAERGVAPFSRWDWWEMKTTASGHAQTLELSHYIDRAQLAALALSHGTLPPAMDQETASEYSRFLTLLAESGRPLEPQEVHLKQKLADEVARWDAAEDERLAQEPLSLTRIEQLRTALRESVQERHRLSAEIAVKEEVPATADTARPILGMNMLIPRHYLVDKIFKQTYADPKQLGHVVAQGFAKGEESRIVSALRRLPHDAQAPTASAIARSIEALGNRAEHFVLLTPYGGLNDIHGWYSTEFRRALERVTHIETAVLDNEAFLFDRRSTLSACRKPEEKEGLDAVAGTSIALGVFEDVQDGDVPKVRLETGEYFVVWPGDAPHVIRFHSTPTDEEGGAAGDESAHTSAS